MRLPAKILRKAAVWGFPAALLMLPGASVAPEHRGHRTDPRVERLETFFDRYHCPEPHYSPNYVAAADRHGIDYRILPAISLLESTCGQFQKLNNHWGWNNGESGFDSIAAGIDHIAKQLAVGRPYRGRSLEAKLLSYNRDPAYGAHVKRVMKQIENYSSSTLAGNNPNAAAGF